MSICLRLSVCLSQGDASRSESDDDVFSSDFDDEDRLRELLSSGTDVVKVYAYRYQNNNIVRGFFFFVVVVCIYSMSFLNPQGQR